jgi:hypothetical protein
MIRRSKNYTSIPPFSKQLSSEMADFLRKFEPWGWFVTATFKVEVSPDFAYRQLKKWIRTLNISLYGRRYRERRRGVTYAVAVEYQKRGVIHFHLLVSADVLKLRRMTWEGIWEKQYSVTNGFMRIYPYDGRLGAVGYLGKYLSKGGDIDIHVSPRLYEYISSRPPTLFQVNPPA